MYGNARFVLAGTFTILMAGAASAHQAKGPPPATQTAPPATQAQPPGTLGQSQTNPPPTQTQPPAGQSQLPGTLGQSQGANAKTGPAGVFQPQVGQQSAFQGNVSQTPWFSDAGVQKHLNLAPAQVNQLNKTYRESLNNYNMGLQGLDKLSDQQRAARIQELSSGFHKGVVEPAVGILNAQQLQRFNQLHLQSQGYGALSNPEIQQKLNLTNDQSIKLRQYEEQYNQNAGDIFKGGATDAQGTTKRYDELRRQNYDRINSLFTPQQIQTWREMTGDYYSLPPNQSAPNQSGKK